jgi:hypothetical protein
MTNKKFFIGMAVLLSVSLFLIGCPADVDETIIDNSKTIGEAADVNALQALLDKPGVNPVTYNGTLAIGAGQIVVPAGKTLVAADGVTLGTTGKFIVAGGLDLGNSKISVTGAGLVIGSGEVLAKVDSDDGTAVKGVVAADVAKATAAFTDAAALVTVAMVPTANDTNVVADNVPADKILYVSGTLTLGAAPTLAGSVVALGTVSVTAAAIDLSSVSNLDIASATLTGTAETVVTLASGTAAVKAVKVGGDDLTIAGATGLTAKEVTSAGGTLVLTGAVTAVTIGGGNGKLEFETGSPSFATDSSFGNTGSTTFRKDVATAKDISFAGPVTFDGKLDNSAAAVLTFNGATAITGAVTTGAALTIGGTGAVTLSVAPTLTNGLVVTNTTGVTIPSVATSLPSEKVINASAGKVIFGSNDGSVTIVKGTLTSTENAAVTVAADGVVALPFSSDGASLVLNAGGSIAIAGTGSVTAWTVKLSGGTFTNGAGVLTLVAEHATTTASLTGTTLTKLTLGVGATIDIPAGVTEGFTLTGVIVDLSSGGAITITDAGVLKLGTSAANAVNVGGIITKYSGTETVVAAGGKASTATLSKAVNVTAFDSTADYAAVVTAIGTGVSELGVFTAGSGLNNKIGKDDTFDLNAVSPDLKVIAAED